MTQRRMEAALSSIFLPRDSVYAQLDNPPVDSTASHTDSLSSPTRDGTASSNVSLGLAHHPNPNPNAADDPFSLALTSPTTVEDLELPTTATAVAATRHSSTTASSRSPPRSRSSYPSRPNTMVDSKSPFIDDHPFESSSSSVFHPTSIGTPSRLVSTVPPPPPPLASRATPRGTSHTRSSSAGSTSYGIGVAGGGVGGVGGGLALSGTSSGGRSLMALLSGASRHDVGSPFDGSVGVGVGGQTLREEDEDQEELAGNETNEVALRDRVRRGEKLSLESRALAASLPPPPSALSDPSSPTEASDDEEDDDEEDAPPDFTTRVPLMATSTSGNNRRRSSSRASTASSWAPAPNPGLRLGGPRGGLLGVGAARQTGLGAKERALWRWINVDDLDSFLQQAYIYYVGKGIWAIGLSRLLNLLTVGWVIVFSTFLIGCIDYSILWDSHHLSEVVVPKCVSRFSGLTLLIAMSFSLFYCWRVVRFGLGVRKLWEMHEFFTELLEVPENDIQAIPWHAIVTRISALRATHPSALSSRAHSLDEASGGNPHRLDAHDVANRIMREENYLIALFNKDVLDLSIPAPVVVGRLTSGTKWGTSMLTQTLEWNLSFCLVGFLFGRDGQVRRAFLLERNKKELVEALRRRFILMGLINALFAPFIVVYLLMYSFFRYFEEYHKNPSSIGSRQFTPLARWKFREFNELPHLFAQRLALAHPLADAYVNQYPKARTALVSRFIAFLAGSFAAVLILFSLIDPDAFLHFEITPGRTVLFYIGVFGTILAVARGMVPDENKIVDPAETMREIVEHTHYLPIEWKDKLHSSEVHASFGRLFQMKIALFVKEILSVIVTPFVLWYTLPTCAGPIVDFFREFTVHVDGLGYVCSFAVFDFKRHGDAKFGAPTTQVRDERWTSGEGKMEKSLLTFAAHNPAWIPRDQTQSLFLSRMTEIAPHSSSNVGGSGGGGVHIGASTTAHAHPHHPRFAGSILLSPPATAGLVHTTRSSSIAARGSRFPDLVEEGTSRIGGGSLPGSRILNARRGGGAGAGAGAGNTTTTVRGRPTTIGAEEAIVEESRLDGEAFVAPLKARPFEESIEDQSSYQVEESGDGGVEGSGVKGMLGELYNLQGKKW